MFILQPWALQEGAWEQPAPALCNQAGPQLSAGEFPSPSPVLRPLCPGAALQPPGEASWSLGGELTLAPHLGCTSLCAEVTSRGLPGGDIIPQAVSNRQRPRLPGESLQGRVLRSWEGKRRALPL